MTGQNDQSPSRFQRVNVVGTSGSGKSALSRRLAQLWAYPLIEMDQLYWRPGWRMSEDPDFFERLAASLNQPTWVLDGNYQRTEAVKWREVDAVVWLDLSFAQTLVQVTRRAMSRAWHGNELWPGTGNRESFRQTFLTRNSVIWWMITSHARNRRDYLEKMNDPNLSRIKFVRLRSHRAARLFLVECARGQDS